MMGSALYPSVLGQRIVVAGRQITLLVVWITLVFSFRNVEEASSWNRTHVIAFVRDVDTVVSVRLLAYDLFSNRSTLDSPLIFEGGIGDRTIV